MVQTVDWLIFWSPRIGFNLVTQKLEIEQCAELSLRKICPLDCLLNCLANMGCVPSMQFEIALQSISSEKAKKACIRPELITTRKFTLIYSTRLNRSEITSIEESKVEMSPTIFRTTSPHSQNQIRDSPVLLSKHRYFPEKIKRIMDRFQIQG